MQILLVVVVANDFVFVTILHFFLMIAPWFRSKYGEISLFENFQKIN